MCVTLQSISAFKTFAQNSLSITFDYILVVAGNHARDLQTFAKTHWPRFGIAPLRPNIPCMMADHSIECRRVSLLQDSREYTIPDAKQGLQLLAGKTSWISLGANTCAEG